MSGVEQLQEATQVVREVGGRVKQYLTMAAGSLGLTGGRALSGPLHAEIGISDPCNHKCVMCYNYPPDDRHSDATEGRFGLLPPGLMSLDTFKGIVDDLHRLGTRRVDLVARGEPLLNRAAVDMVARHRRQRAVRLENSMGCGLGRALPGHQVGSADDQPQPDHRMED